MPQYEDELEFAGPEEESEYEDEYDYEPDYSSEISDEPDDDLEDSDWEEAEDELDLEDEED